LDVEEREVIAIVGRVLGLEQRAPTLTRDSQLLGSVPELDSMAVVTLINSLEEQFGFVIEDDEIDGTVFTTIGSLIDFVKAKRAN